MKDIKSYQHINVDSLKRQTIHCHFFYVVFLYVAFMWSFTDFRIFTNDPSTQVKNKSN